MIPLTLQLNVEIGRDMYRTVAEAMCHKVPKKIADKFPHMGGGDYWLLHRLWVHKDYRRKGFGAQLMSDLVKLCNDRGVSLVLRTVPHNRKPDVRDLRRFYRRFGFKRVRGGGDLMERV